ncbi:protein KRI1 homolog [Sylvia atricapilla]|uniref:protein KRI1 homolog n=1 Tax=Sylvia atricapilla TaxID=48155 RepID=UPI003399C6EA
MAEPKLRVNAAFAERYGRYRQREELQRLRDRYGDTRDSGDSSDSDSSESSGDDVTLDPREEREFYRTLALLKTRDPRIYREDTTFYTREESGEEDEEDEGEEEERPAKPMFLKDYERKVVLEKEGKYVDEEDEEDEEAAAKRRKAESSQSYMEEQRALKESFRAFVADSEEEEDEEGGALLRPRVQSREEKEQEEEQYLRWLRGQAEPPPEPLQDLEPLQKFWSDPGLEPGERFLRDYLLGNGFREEEEEEEEEGAAPGPLEDSSDEGEQFLQRQQEFERRHNFRFEEPGAAQVQTFPRHIPSSVRRRDERRKEKREQIRERKKKDRERRREELKQLKNLKRQELAARLARIRDASGCEAFGLTGSLLQEDFDPARHDRLMAEWFGDEFYGQAEEEKPQFEEEEGLDDDWNWVSWTGREEGDPQREPHCEDPDFVMDADFVPEPPSDPAAPPGRAPPEVTFGKRRRKSRFREALEREKPPFDPASGPFEQYLDEFYSLDFEDVVGDLPCRFKYRRVLPCDFGLTTDEILAADDKELNRWCSLRKTCMYRSEQEERQDQANFSRRAQNLRRKHQILRSLRADPEEEEEEAAPAKPKFGKKRREKRKRLEQAEKGEPPAAPQNPGGPRRRGGTPLGPAVRLGGREFSGKRLEAFGLNPRRIRFRQLRRQEKKGGGNPGETPEKPGQKPGKNSKKNPEKNPENTQKNVGINPGKTQKNVGIDPGKSPGGTGTTAAVNGKKQKRRKNAPNPPKKT